MEKYCQTVKTFILAYQLNLIKYLPFNILIHIRKHRATYNILTK